MRRLRAALSDSISAALLLFAAFSPYGHALAEPLSFGLLVEGGFLMMQGTLIDIATRLKKRPPLWLVVLILIGVVIFSQHSMSVLEMAWDRGMVVFIPLLVSIAQRGRALWTMPEKTREEKIAARALVANRITTGLGILGLLAITLVASMVAHEHTDALMNGMNVLVLGALYFAIAAFDAWRVRGPKFAEKPTVLFRFDPLHITYLEPL